MYFKIPAEALEYENKNDESTIATSKMSMCSLANGNYYVKDEVLFGT